MIGIEKEEVLYIGHELVLIQNRTCSTASLCSWMRVDLMSVSRNSTRGGAIDRTNGGCRTQIRK